MELLCVDIKRRVVKWVFGFSNQIKTHLVVVTGKHPALPIGSALPIAVIIQDELIEVTTFENVVQFVQQKRAAALEIRRRAKVLKLDVGVGAVLLREEEGRS